MFLTFVFSPWDFYSLGQIKKIVTTLRSAYGKSRPSAKYSTLEDQYIFQPIAVESLGPMNWEARKFLADLVCLETRGIPRFCFSAFLFCYFVSILFCCTIVLSWTTARNISLSILSQLFQFFPTLVFRGFK